jgi:tetratricopeptide (TPR) repeat protein
MSSDDEKSSDITCCASCGAAAIDDVELKDCDDGCGLVKYCSDNCQETNLPQHKAACQERLAESRDRDLFSQPDGSYLGECPICCLPMPIDPTKFAFMGCCSKTICNGCDIANSKREREQGLQQRCPFCREPTPKSDDEGDKKVMKRIKENNDPAAMRFMGRNCIDEGDYETAFKYFTKAAELGEVGAHHNLAVMYINEEGVEKDAEKYTYHLEEAAIGGHPDARHTLGCKEGLNGRFERARKHWIIAANLGYHDSLNELRGLYADGHASKEDYAAALRAYQSAVDATKSAEREEAERYYEFVAAGSRSKNIF